MMGPFSLISAQSYAAGLYSHDELHFNTLGRGVRSRVDGPSMFSPFLSKQDPWQGQFHSLSEGFHCSKQPRCGQTALYACV